MKAALPKPEALVHCELYHLLRLQGIKVVPEVGMPSRHHRSGWFYADLGVYRPDESEPCALIECKRNVRVIPKSTRQGASYAECGLPYFVAGRANLEEAVAWALERTTA